MKTRIDYQSGLVILQALARLHNEGLSVRIDPTDEEGNVYVEVQDEGTITAGIGANIADAMAAAVYDYESLSDNE